MSFSRRFASFLRASIGLRIFLAFFAVYAITAPGGFEVIDGEARYQTAKSWLAGDGGALPPEQEHFGVPAPDGRHFAWYGPFQSALMTPFIAVIAHLPGRNPDQLFKLVFSVLVIPLVSALSLAIQFRALRTLRFSERDAFLSVVLIGLATPLWHYGRSGQEENIIGLAFALYLWGIGQLIAGRVAGLKLVTLGSCIIFATRWQYVPSLAILLVPVVMLLWERRADFRHWWPSLAYSSALGGSVVLAVLWYNYSRFGRPLEGGYGVYFRFHPPFFVFDKAPSQFVALVLSPYRGLLWFCPALVLLFAKKRAPQGIHEARLWRATLGAWAFTWLFISTFFFWQAGPTWGPRYFIALIVLLGPAFASVFATGRRWYPVIALSLFAQFCSTVLPSAYENSIYDSKNVTEPGSCTPWVCRCSALCLRAPQAFEAVVNTVASRPLPTVDLQPATSIVSNVPALETSDFNSVYWWPVRSAYRAHTMTPALAFAACLAVLSAALSALWFFYRKLPDAKVSGATVDANAA